MLAKLVKRESLQDYEKRLPARRYAHRPLTAFSIPAAVMTMGLFYIFGSLEHLHGAQPSERTFLGVIPIMTSTNVTMRMILSSRLKAA